jgi:hypothetical protein
MTQTIVVIMNRKILSQVLIANPFNVNIQKTYTAIWDTGSMETMISNKIVKELGLSKGKKITYRDANNKATQSFRCDIFLQPDGHTKTFTLQSPILLKNKKECDIIIGMDIIELLEFHIQNNILTITII